MNTIHFQDLPLQYQAMKDGIQNEYIQQIYSKFFFRYLTFSEIKNEEKNSITNSPEDFIISHLKDFKFITYLLMTRIGCRLFNKNIDINSDQSDYIHVIFCAENECIMIHDIPKSKFTKILNELKNLHISLINSNIDLQNDEGEEIDRLANEEINCFITHFIKEIKRNKFVNDTIRPIVGYLIRRYFYPTKFFKDPNFFTFDSKTKEQETKSKLKELIFTRIDTDKKFEFIGQDEFVEIANEINAKDNQIYLKDFQKNEFILLRKIHDNGKAYFYLVIHLQTLFIFMMKI